MNATTSRNQNIEGFTNSEVASLAASCVAAGISLVIAPGAYDQFGAVISLTLLLVIIGSLGRRKRPAWQNAAISASIGLSLLPLTGFLWEAALSGSFVVYLSGLMSLSCDNGRVEAFNVLRELSLPSPSGLELNSTRYECVGDTPGSRVPVLFQTCAWVTSGFMSFVWLSLTNKD